jgi:flagellar hook-basal body complex protein FliE
MSTASKTSGPGVTISERLAVLETRLTTISRNLMELSETEFVKIMRVRVKDANNGYVGAMRQRASSALALIDNLWSSYLLVAQVHEQACALQKRDGLFRHFDEDILALLDGKSVELSSRHIPITSRELLSQGHEVAHATIDEVLADMQLQFSTVRDAVGELRTATEQAEAKKASLNEQIKALKDSAGKFGMNATVPSSVDAILLGARRDPLDLLAKATVVEDEIARQWLSMKNSDGERRAVMDTIEKARVKLVTLANTSEQALAAYQAARDQINDRSALSRTDGPADVEFLSEWLERIEHTVAGGRFAAARVGLSRWAEDFDARLRNQQASIEVNRRTQAAVNEIKGRFGALCAKRSAMSAKGLMLDPRIALVEQETKQALDVAQLDLAAANKIVTAYETLLNNTIGSTRS